MSTSIARSGACLVVLLAPLTALAASGAPTICVYATRYENTPRGSGVVRGTMRLSVEPDGIVNGTYRSFDEGTTSVTGGLGGRSIWLNIPALSRPTLTGTIEPDGTIVASAGRNLDRWTFEATPTTARRKTEPIGRRR